MGRIKQSMSLIHFKLVTTAHFNAINQIKDSKQAYKQIKHDVKTSVISFIFLISSELSVLFAPDLVSATFIV